MYNLKKVFTVLLILSITLLSIFATSQSPSATVTSSAPSVLYPRWIGGSLSGTAVSGNAASGYNGNTYLDYTITFSPATGSYTTGASYQWYTGTSSASGSSISGANSSTYTFNKTSAGTYNFVCKVTVGGASYEKAVKYVLTDRTYTITKSNGTGISNISGDTSYTYSPNSQIKSYTATASTGYTFSSWSTGKGSFSANTASSTLTIPAAATGDFTITANATPNNYTISYSTGSNGSVSGDTSFTFSTSSQTKSITISPNSGYELDSISVSGGSATLTGSGNSRTLNIPASCTSTITVSTSFKSSWYGVALTGASSRTIVFYNISGSTLYTNSACTSVASTNVKYTNQTFYYKSNTSKPTAQYIYNLGDGARSSNLPSKDTLNSYISYLATLFSSSGTLWSGTEGDKVGKYTYYVFYNFSTSSWNPKGTNGATSRHRANFSSL